MSKTYKKITKSISLYESKIHQESKNPFSKSPKKTVNYIKCSQATLLNSSLCEKTVSKPIINLNDSAAQLLVPSIPHRKRSGSDECSNMLGKFINKAVHIDDYIQKEFAIMSTIGPISEDKLNIVSMEKEKNKKLLVLDLENVLIHLIDFRNTELYTDIDINPKCIKTIRYYLPSKKTFIFNKIIIRPYLEYFISILKSLYHIVVISSSDKPFTDAIISSITSHTVTFDKVLSSEHCILRNSQCIKDLRIFSNWNLKDIVFVANSMTHFMAQLDNGVLIKSFIGSDEDKDLKDLCSLLVKLSKEIDVRVPLKALYGYTNLFTLFLDTNEGSI